MYYTYSDDLQQFDTKIALLRFFTMLYCVTRIYTQKYVCESVFLKSIKYCVYLNY